MSAAYNTALKNLQRTLPQVANSIAVAGRGVRVIEHGPWLGLIVDLPGGGRRRTSYTLAVTQDGHHLMVLDRRPETHPGFSRAPQGLGELDRWWIDWVAGVAEKKTVDNDLSEFAQIVGLMAPYDPGAPSRPLSERAGLVLSVLERIDLPTLALFHSKEKFSARAYEALAAMSDEPGSIRRFLRDYPLLLPPFVDEIMNSETPEGAISLWRQDAADPFQGRPTIDVVADVIGQAIMRSYGTAVDRKRVLDAIGSLKGKVWEGGDDSFTLDHLGLMTLLPKAGVPRNGEAWGAFVEIANEAMQFLRDGIAADRLFPDFDGDWKALRRAILEAAVSRWSDAEAPASLAEPFWIVKGASELIGSYVTDVLAAEHGRNPDDLHAQGLPHRIAERLEPRLFDERPFPELVRGARAMHDDMEGYGEPKDGGSSFSKEEVITLVGFADRLLPEELRGLSCTDLMERIGFDMPEMARLIEAGLPVEFDRDGEMIPSQGRTLGT